MQDLTSGGAIYKVINNYTSKHEFAVLLCCSLVPFFLLKNYQSKNHTAEKFEEVGNYENFMVF